MLYLRVLSALVGIPIVIGAVYMGGPWYAILLMLVANLGIFEYLSMLRARDHKAPLAIGFIGVSLFLVAIYLDLSGFIYPIIMLIFSILFMHSLFGMGRQSIAESAVLLWGII